MLVPTLGRTDRYVSEHIGRIHTDSCCPPLSHCSLSSGTRSRVSRKFPYPFSHLPPRSEIAIMFFRSPQAPHNSPNDFPVSLGFPSWRHVPQPGSLACPVGRGRTRTRGLLGASGEHSPQRCTWLRGRFLWPAEFSSCCSHTRCTWYRNAQLKTHTQTLLIRWWMTRKRLCHIY